MLVSIIEISKPPKRYWVKTLRGDYTFLIILVLATFVFLIGRENGIMSGIILTLQFCLVLVLGNLFSSLYKYPYKITVFQDYLEIHFIFICIKSKRRYRYKHIEIVTKFHKKKQYIIIRHRVFINYGLVLRESDGWSKEKQYMFIEIMKTSGIEDNRLT